MPTYRIPAVATVHGFLTIEATSESAAKKAAEDLENYDEAFFSNIDISDWGPTGEPKEEE
jgi:hypothetical protein